MSLSASPPIIDRGDTAAPNWSDVVGSEMWLYGRAECGCATYQHVDHDFDEYAGEPLILATLHDSETCSAGLSVAHIPVGMRSALRGIAVPARAILMAVEPAMLAGVLRGLPITDGAGALAAVAAERETEAEHTETGIASVEAYLARWAAAEDDEELDAANHVSCNHLPLDGDPAATWFAATLNPLDPQGEYPGDDLRRRAEARVRHEAALAGEVATEEAIKARHAAVEAALATVEEMVPVTEMVPPAAPVAAAPEPDRDERVLAEAAGARLEESALLTIELKAFLARDPEHAAVEIAALMAMPLADRAEAVVAAKAGRLTRLGLTIQSLGATMVGSRQAWIRLREGTAGTWSMADVVPFTDAEMTTLMNPERAKPAFGRLFYGRGVQILAGGGGIGKTWVALDACMSAIPPVPYEGMGVLAVYVDLDQNFELYTRLGQAGLAQTYIQNRNLAILNVPKMAGERGASPIGMLWSIIAGLQQSPPKVVVVDSLTRIISATDEGNSNDNDLATRVLSAFDALAERCAVIIIDHTGHEAERPRGASAKIDAVQNVVTIVETTFKDDAFPGVFGGGKVISTKDRDGGVKAAYRDPADPSTKPTLGLMPIVKDPTTGKIRVDFIPQRVIAGAKERRDSDAGQQFAAEARAVIRRVVDAAARAAVTVERAQETGTKPVAPLSASAAGDAAWEQLKDSAGGGKRSDVRAAVTAMTKAGELVEYVANFGSVSGARLRLKGGITDGVLDPVDLS